jgi:hypothetical protein
LAFHSGREADHSPPSSAEVEEWVELYIHSPNTPSWLGAQLGEHRDNFTLPLPYYYYYYYYISEPNFPGAEFLSLFDSWHTPYTGISLSLGFYLHVLLRKIGQNFIP